MTLNKYFRNHSYGQEQDLASDLVNEAIRIHGIDVKYLPRTIVKDDALFGEDYLSRFTDAVVLEAYVKNVTGFEGQGDFLSKFNLEIRDSMTLTIARKRWGQISTEKVLDEVGYNLQVETANTSAYGVSDSIRMESGGANNYSITSTRPMEGDLVYLPLNDKLFEVKFVEHEATFYQFGKLATYDLSCELFEYSGERLDTGNTAIDSIETTLTTDVLTYQFQTEAGDTLVGEDGGYMLQEYRVETTVLTANNELYATMTNSIVDWSEARPWSEDDRF